MFLEQVVKLTSTVKTELRWWAENLDSVSSYPFNTRLTGRRFAFSTAGDASDVGYFTYEVDSTDKLECRSFTLVERAKSSTFRELLALAETWTNVKTLLRYKNSRVKHCTDNKAVSFILVSGSSKPDLHKLVVDVALACREYNIQLEVEWVSRDDPVIEFADWGSCSFFSDNVQLDFQNM